jgi:PilX N-terminal
MSINNTSKKSPIVTNNERGSALIIAIMLLAIMSILGVVMMSTTTTEIQLSGNYRNNQESFYTADRTVEYAMQSASGGSGVVDLYDDQNNSIIGNPVHRSLVAIGQSDLEASNVTATDERNSVIYISSGAPPVGSGSDASLFEARNYAVNAVGIFPANTNNPSRTELRSQFAKIVPK